MKKIALQENMFALVDDEDFDLLTKYKWCARKDRNTYYARASIDGVKILMHRFLLQPKKPFVTDHINGNGLDNQRSNLRLATIAQNAMNKISKFGTSQYKGVCWITKRNHWIATIWKNNKLTYIKSFKSEIDAAKAYDQKAKELFGDFARLNF